MEPLLVILDLDGTLVHATGARLEREPAFATARYFVYTRPHLDVFLRSLFDTNRVAVWTSSDRSYALQVVAHIMPPASRLEFVWCAERCTLRFDPEALVRRPLKNLRKVRRRGFDLARVVCIDDSREKHVQNYGNLIPIDPFEGTDDGDTQLLEVLAFVQTLSREPDVRVLDKRAWRQPPLRGA